MDRQIIINKTVKKISQLPDWRLKEVEDYVDFLLKKNEDQGIRSDIQKVVSQGKSFDFLEEEEELYHDSDLTERFHEKG
ncbi:hypothetical protein [Salinimicrobium sp. GXAS 041]|uniref:hypothetical protein n=1 Tax=Salinimicrobium sp. GXAS 041 TaxID=3400806 RepID=UPI003C717FAD